MKELNMSNLDHLKAKPRKNFLQGDKLKEYWTNNPEEKNKFLLEIKKLNKARSGSAT